MSDTGNEPNLSREMPGRLKGQGTTTTGVISQVLVKLLSGNLEFLNALWENLAKKISKSLENNSVNSCDD